MQGQSSALSISNDYLPKPEAQLVYICGSGHSGSTLLDMLLGGHSEIAGLGEAHRLHYHWRDAREADVCTCGCNVRKCPFWLAVENELRKIPEYAACGLSGLTLAHKRIAHLRNEQGEFIPQDPHSTKPRIRSRLNEGVMVIGSKPLRKLVARFSNEVRHHLRIAEDSILLYDAVRKAHGKPVIVDSTKNAGRLKGLYLSRNCRMSFIRVIRDGRAVCWSRMRRVGTSIENSIKIWKDEHLKLKSVLLTIPEQSIYSVHYEDLASKPEETLEKVCSFLKLEYRPEMLNFRDDRHNLGGNPMRFRSSEQQIRLDERWREEMPSDALEVFNKTGARLNRKLGYMTHRK